MRHFPLEGLLHPQHGITSLSEQQNNMLHEARNGWLFVQLEAFGTRMKIKLMLDFPPPSDCYKFFYRLMPDDINAF